MLSQVVSPLNRYRLICRRLNHENEHSRTLAVILWVFVNQAQSFFSQQTIGSKVSSEAKEESLRFLFRYNFRGLSNYLIKKVIEHTL